MASADSTEAVPVKVKQEKTDDPDEPVAVGGGPSQTVKIEDTSKTVKEEIHVKTEPKPDPECLDAGVKDEHKQLKNEDTAVKNEGLPVKNEAIKKEEKDDTVKNEQLKREGDADMYALAKHEQSAKNEQIKNEGDAIKRELKKERSRSPRRDDKKNKKKEEKKKGQNQKGATVYLTSEKKGEEETFEVTGRATKTEVKMGP